MNDDERLDYQEEQDQKFDDQLEEVGLRIVKEEKDGNCLFRAFSYQIYGDPKHHKLVRRKCMRYMQIERDKFKDFVSG